MSMIDTAQLVEPPDTPPAIAALFVRREDLAKACDRTRYVSCPLHAIESLSELDWEEMDGLCHAIHQAVSLLQTMLEAGAEKKQAARNTRAIAQAD